MKNLIKAFAVSATLLFAQSALAANACPGIEAGTKAYNEKDYERAIDEWRSCVDNGIQDADLYYNLGNAYFRNAKLGFAIFYYKSALRLNPNDSDIQHNLAYAQAMTKDKVDEDDEENPLLAGLYKAHHALSLKVQLFVILGIFWLIVLAAVGNRVSLSEKRKNVFMGIIFALTAVASVIVVSAGYKVFLAETEVTGVVTAADADVTSAPDNKAQTLNTLSEGTSFEVLSQQGAFVEIRLGEKVKGFVKHSDVGIIK
ncbi:MAG: tetratricopeptide repeat protein [Fibrobacter sp.]|nr:tetratricopeptide repeat protein [Fibrobacter sp.]